MSKEKSSLTKLSTERLIQSQVTYFSWPRSDSSRSSACLWKLNTVNKHTHTAH